MNRLKAIEQLEDLKKDRLSFLHNNELDRVFLEDIKAITMAIEALKKCKDEDVKGREFHCRMCGKELRTWRSIQKGFGPICEKEYLNNIYNNQQMSMNSILLKDKINRRER